MVMERIPGVSTFYRDEDSREQDGRFSVSFTLERNEVGFRALNLLTFTCSEVAYAKRGEIEVKASYRDTSFTAGKILCFELSGTGSPEYVADVCGNMLRILTMARRRRARIPRISAELTTNALHVLRNLIGLRKI
jgi:hypothetical protein